MRKYFSIITIALTMACAANMSAQTGNQPSKGAKTLTILHTNDTHSCIYPLGTTLSDTAIAGRGGFLRRIAMLEEGREKDADLVLFGRGGFSEGLPY